MADTVTSNFISKGPRNIVVVRTCISDGTGETAAVVLDKSTFTNAKGVEPPILTIDKVEWSAQGFGYLKLAFDHNTDDTALVLSGGDGGELCFTKSGGLKDPASAGGTGDLLITTTGPTAGDSYTLVVHAHM